MSRLPTRRARESYPVASFRHEMDRLLDNFFGAGWPGTDLAEFAHFPALDVSENEDTVTVRAEVPGMDADDIDISLVGDQLTVRGEKKEETKDEGETSHRIERRYGRFERTVTLPGLTEADQSSAVCKDGVLTITLPKKEEAKKKPSKIAVE